MDMTSFLQGIAPRATNQLLQSSSPRGSPRAHRWTERPGRSTPSTPVLLRDGGLPSDLDDPIEHAMAVMAGAGGPTARAEKKSLVFLRFVFTPFGPAPYARRTINADYV